MKASLYQNRLRTALFVLAAWPQLAGAAPRLRVSASASPPVIVYNDGDGTLQPAVTSNRSWLLAALIPSPSCAKKDCHTLLTSYGPGVPVNESAIATLTISDPAAIDSPQTFQSVRTGDIYAVPKQIVFYSAPGDPPVFQDVCTAFPGDPKVTSGAPWLTLREFLQRGCNFHTLVIATASADTPEGVLAGEVGIKVNNAGCCVRPTAIPVSFNVTRALLLNFPAQGPSFHLAPKGPRMSQPVSITRRSGPAIGEIRVTTAVEGPVNWLSAEITSVTPDEARLAVSATAAGLTPAFYHGSVTIQSGAVNGPATLPVELEVTADSGPVVTYRGAADNSTFDASVPLALGSIVAAFGQQLLNDTPVAAGPYPLPTELGRTRMLVNGAPAPLYYASYNQVNFQVPFTVSGGEILLQPVRDGVAGNTISAALRPRSPAIPSLQGYGAVSNSDGTQAAPASIPGAHPAVRGSAVVIYATSLGVTSPLVPAGTPSPADPPARILVPVKVFFGSPSSTGEVFFAGLSPGSVGLYQVNVWVPESASTGDRVPIWLSVDGSDSNRVTIAIQ